MCVFECCIFAKSIHLSLISWRDWYFKNSNNKSKIAKADGLGKNQIAYMKHIKYGHATWASYSCQRV